MGNIWRVIVAGAVLSATAAVLAQERQAPFRKGDAGVSDPVLTKEVHPRYTREAMQARIEGTIELDAVVREDGSVVAWGKNAAGQLGDGTTTNRPSPGVVGGLASIVALAGHGAHTFAVATDGTVYSWGGDGFGSATIANLRLNQAAIRLTAAAGDADQDGMLDALESRHELHAVGIDGQRIRLTIDDEFAFEGFVEGCHVSSARRDRTKNRCA